MDQNNAPQPFWKTTKHLGLFSLPIILNSFIGIVPTLASMWILSRLGKYELAAAGIAAPTFYTIMTLFVTGFYAMGIKVGHSFGKKEDPRLTGQWLKNGLALALILAIPAIALLLSAPLILLYFGQKPHLVAIARPFFSYGALAITPMLLFSAINQFFAGTSHPKIAFTLSLVTLPLVIFLSYALILGRFGLPQLGIGGINCAAFIVDSMVVCIAFGIILFAPWCRPFHVFSRKQGVNLKQCLSLIKLGWPISLQISGELAAMTAAAYLLGLFGTDALAAAQITGQYGLSFVMIAIGLSQGVSILTSQAFGANNLIQIQQIAKAGISLILIVAGLFAIGLLFFPEVLTNLYLHTHRLEHQTILILTTHFMAITTLYIAFDGTRSMLNSSLRGIQDPKFPMIMGFIGFWVIGLPLSYIIGIQLQQGPVIMRLVFTLGMVIATVILIGRYYYKIRHFKPLKVPGKIKNPKKRR